MTADKDAAQSGRIQTRLGPLALAGLSWSLLADAFLPADASHAVAVASLVIVGGVGWETLYHAGQRLRRDEDWSSRSGLLIALFDATLACLVLRALDVADDSALRYLLYFSSAWMLIWLVTQGLRRAAAAGWRYSGAWLTRPRPRHAPRPVRHRRAFGAITAAVGVATALGLVFVLATDKTPAPEMAHTAPAARPAAPPNRSVVAVNNPTVRVVPIAVHLPKLAADSSLIRLGLDANQRMQTPSVTTPMQAGWYEPGPAPGQTGPAVIVGHVDGASQPGIFYRLHELAPGDRVTVERADGSVLTFVVRRTIHASKDRFPTKEVYGRTAGPELRLITCGGSFDRAVRSYRDNIIVFAQLDGEQQQ
ncbi:class F sortase [Amycolatopsis sp. cg13]|uniref:class F sortase n=1 Tax=Amycolatopsis sp. cg13 TaxID=3238807 RepID=UPI0035268EDE